MVHSSLGAVFTIAKSRFPAGRIIGIGVKVGQIQKIGQRYPCTASRGRFGTPSFALGLHWWICYNLASVWLGDMLAMLS